MLSKAILQTLTQCWTLTNALPFGWLTDDHRANCKKRIVFKCLRFLLGAQFMKVLVLKTKVQFIFLGRSLPWEPSLSHTIGSHGVKPWTHLPCSLTSWGWQEADIPTRTVPDCEMKQAIKEKKSLQGREKKTEEEKGRNIKERQWKITLWQGLRVFCFCFLITHL